MAAALEGPGGEHAGADLGGRLAVGGAGQLVGGEPLHLDVEVDTVEQRPGEPAGVAVQVVQAAAAGEPAVPQMPAGAGVGRGDQGEAGREADRGHGPRDRDLALLERLAERLAGGPGELRQLVQEQDPAVGQSSAISLEGLTRVLSGRLLL